MHNQVVILGTGGTIAGAAACATDAVGYSAAQRSVADLLAAVPPLTGQALEVEQIAQIDSKDMDAATWQRLALSVQRHLARAEVAGVVITHGTDTLEETAYFLHRVLKADKPVVLTAAMRPATALQADGPQQLLDAVTVAREPGARGVCVAFAGQVFSPTNLHKTHSYRMDAFEAREGGALAFIEEGCVRSLAPWPSDGGDAAQALHLPIAQWPAVAVLMHHVSVEPRLVAACQALGMSGIVLAGSGNGTCSRALEAALRQAQQAGVVVWRATRCAGGSVLALPGEVPAAPPGLSAVQARVALMLMLACQRTL